MTTAQKITMRCGRCGGDDVLRDAWAAWNVETQEWELATVFDDAHCNACDGETRIEEVPVTAEEA